MESESADDAMELIGLIAAGDRGAFERFYDRYSPSVFALALRMLNHRAAAEDLVQDVFLQVWKNASRFDARRGQPEAWLLTVARNRAIDRLRADGSARQGVKLYRDQHSVPNVESPSVIQNEDRRSVHAALTMLNEDQRRVLEMAYFDGLSQSEIAERLNAPLGTVKSRMRIGMERLRQHLHAERPGGEAR